MTSSLPVNCAEESRTFSRQFRTIPAVMCGYDNGQVCAGNSAFVLVHDISDEGVGLIANARCNSERVLIGFLHRGSDETEHWFFAGNFRFQSSIGGGFWQLGLELSESVDPSCQHELAYLHDMMAQLTPPLEEALS